MNGRALRAEKPVTDKAGMMEPQTIGHLSNESKPLLLDEALVCSGAITFREMRINARLAQSHC